MADISQKRNVAVASGVAVLLLALLGWYFFSKKDSEDIVNVIQNKIEVPGGFEKIFTDLGVKGIILVSGTGKHNDAFTIRVVGPNGVPVDLCGSVSDTDKSNQPCKLTTTATQLLSVASTNSSSGTCSDGTTLRICHKDGPYQNKWYYHRDPDSSWHHACITTCR
jgi:hypothetical protein